MIFVIEFCRAAAFTAVQIFRFRAQLSLISVIRNGHVYRMRCRIVGYVGHASTLGNRVSKGFRVRALQIRTGKMNFAKGEVFHRAVFRLNAGGCLFRHRCVVRIRLNGKIPGISLLEIPPLQILNTINFHRTAVRFRLIYDLSGLHVVHNTVHVNIGAFRLGYVPQDVDFSFRIQRCIFGSQCLLNGCLNDISGRFLKDVVVYGLEILVQCFRIGFCTERIVQIHVTAGNYLFCTGHVCDFGQHLSVHRSVITSAVSVHIIRRSSTYREVVLWTVLRCTILRLCTAVIPNKKMCIITIIRR